jgi:hypothetical protein
VDGRENLEHRQVTTECQMKEHVFEQATLVADVTNHPVVRTARCTVNSAAHSEIQCTKCGQWLQLVREYH